MNSDALKQLVKGIVEEANNLKNKHIELQDTPVNYACVFSQNQEEYMELLESTKQIGKQILETTTGILFHIAPIETVAGNLKLLKIRLPDKTRPERGDADFTISDFAQFENKYLPQPGFKRIEKQKFYMVELIDPSFNVRAYFSNPPLDKQLGIT